MMMVRFSLVVAALAMPGVALAVTPTAKPTLPGKPAAAAPAKAPLPLNAGTRRVALSPEGRTIAQKVLSTPDPRAAQIQKDAADTRQEIARIVAMPVIDVDKFEVALRRDQALTSQMLTVKNDRMIALVRALPPADRKAFLDTLVNPPRPQNAP
jgi:uncharacterized membrane protein